MTVFAKGAYWALEDLARSDFDVLGLDWTMDPTTTRRLVEKIAKEEEEERGNDGKSNGHAPFRSRPKSLQGNLDPAAMYATEDVLRNNVKAMVSQFCPDGKVEGYIANLGWGMQPYMTPDSARVFIEEAQSASSEIGK